MKTLIASLALSLIITLPAFAADSSQDKHWEVYAKTGWFSWDEQIGGQRFIKDEGMMYAFGATRSDQVYGPLSLTETVELSLGHPTYDGHKMFTGEPVHRTNGYIGIREEVLASVQIPIAGLTLDPFIGIAHKAWARAAEGELWNTIYAPMGLQMTHHFTKDVSVFAKGGVTIPIYTSSYMFLHNSGGGYEDIITRPKAQIGQFGEIGVTISSFSISLSYEATRFDKSDSVTTKSLNGQTSREIFQPDSQTSTSWLKVGYSF